MPISFQYLGQVALVLILLVTAQGSATAAQTPVKSPAIEAMQPLTLAIFPRRNARISYQLFTPLSQFLSRELGREVRLALFKDFASFWEGVERNRYDIVHYNQYHYVKSHKEQGYEVILRNEEYGEATIAGSLVARKDSGINSIQDLKGRRIIFGGGSRAMQSYITATYLLRQGGLVAGDYRESFAKNPPNAIFAVFSGQAAAGGAGDRVLRLKVLTDAIDTSQLKFIARDRQLPHLPWAVRGDMAPDLKQKIQQSLADLKKTPAGRKLLKQARLTGLIPTRDGDYDGHRAIITETLGEAY